MPDKATTNASPQRCPRTGQRLGNWWRSRPHGLAENPLRTGEGAAEVIDGAPCPAAGRVAAAAPAFAGPDAIPTILQASRLPMP